MSSDSLTVTELTSKLEVAMSDYQTAVKQSRRLIKLVRDYLKNAANAEKAKSQLCSELSEFKLNDKEPATSQFVDALRQTVTSHEQYLTVAGSQIDRLDVHLDTMPKFSAHPDYVAYERAKDAYESALKKYNEEKKRKGTDLVAAEKPVEAFRQSLTTVCATAIERQGEFSAALLWELQDKLIGVLSALSSCYSTASTLLALCGDNISTWKTKLETGRPRLPGTGVGGGIVPVSLHVPPLRGALETSGSATSVSAVDGSGGLSSPGSTGDTSTLRKVRQLRASVKLNKGQTPRLPSENLEDVAATVKSANLLKQSGKKWKSYLFILRADGVLVYYRVDKKDNIAEKPKGTFNMLLCTIKPGPDKSVPHSIQIVAPNDAIVVKCATAEEAEAWTAAFKAGISSQLERHKKGAAALSAEESRKLLDDLYAISEANSSCAECGAPAPDWVSVNLGILICHDCSGFHRALGSHLSKVRSLTLDRFEDETLEVVRRIGNERSNQFFESNIVEGYSKPEPSSKPLLKQVWTACKYEQKMFIPRLNREKLPAESDFQQMLFKKLWILALKDDVSACARLLGLGVDVNLHADPDGRTILHVLAAMGHFISLEWAIQNSADCWTRDDNRRLPLHWAAWYGKKDACRLLLRVMTEGAKREVDANGHTAYDCASAAGFDEICPMLKPKDPPPASTEFVKSFPSLDDLHEAPTIRFVPRKDAASPALPAASAAAAAAPAAAEPPK